MKKPLKLLTVLSALTLAFIVMPAPTATAAVSPWACGPTTILKPDGGPWTCTFADDFNGRSLNTSKWTPQLTANSGYHSGEECFVNNIKNISVSGGVLSLTARKETKPFVCASPFGNYTTQVTSGMVSTWAKFSQAYGRFEIRAKFPAAKVAGLQSALWLWPQESKYGGWPHSGEIDIAEFYSTYPDRAIPYVHYTEAEPQESVTNNYCMITDPSAFHSYVVEWTATTITIKYDGATCLVHEWNPAAPLAKPAPFDQPFIVALTQALGVGDNAYNPLTTPMPATMQIDYVRVWS